MKILAPMISPDRGDTVKILVDDTREVFVRQQLRIQGEEYEVVVVENDHVILLQKIRNRVFPAGTECENI